MKEQTAVEWLIDQLNDCKIKELKFLPNTIQFAKLMEKQQLEKAFNNGLKSKNKKT